MANPRAVSLTLPEVDRATLQSWTRRRCTAQSLALRARIVLACAGPGTTIPVVLISLPGSREMPCL